MTSNGGWTQQPCQWLRSRGEEQELYKEINNAAVVFEFMEFFFINTLSRSLSKYIPARDRAAFLSLSIPLVRHAIDRSIGVVPETSGRWMASSQHHPNDRPLKTKSPFDWHPTAKAFLGWTLVLNSRNRQTHRCPRPWKKSSLPLSPLAKCEGTAAQGASTSQPWISRELSIIIFDLKILKNKQKVGPVSLLDYGFTLLRIRHFQIFPLLQIGSHFSVSGIARHPQTRCSMPHLGLFRFQVNGRTCIYGKKTICGAPNHMRRSVGHAIRASELDVCPLV